MRFFNIILIVPVALLVAACCPDSCKKQDEILKRNKAVVLQYFNEVMDQGDYTNIDKLVSANYINHSSNLPNLAPGIQGLLVDIKGLREAFPDVHFDILDMVVSENMVAIRSVMTGTQTGNFFGIPPTNKPIKVDQMQFERIDSEGKMCEHWRVTDNLTLQQQLGIIPTH